MIITLFFLSRILTTRMATMADFPVPLGDELNFCNSDVGISKTSMLDFQKLRWHFKVSRRQGDKVKCAYRSSVTVLLLIPILSYSQRLNDQKSWNDRENVSKKMWSQFLMTFFTGVTVVREYFLAL